MESRRSLGINQYDDEDDDETSKLLRTIPPGISARTHSISGTQSMILEPPEVYKSRWRSIRVMYLTMFLSSVSFSICMSSLYPYLKILDPTANTNFLGWVVAAYSVGQLVASPLFGAWFNYRSKTREPVIASLFINVLANVLYMYLESINSHSKILLMVARVLIGFGAGNVAVVRSYVSGATTLKERTPAMANMSAFQAVGFIIGPLIQTAMVPIGYPGVVHTDALHLDMYTATALFSALVGILNVVLLIAVFKEHTVKDDQFSPTNIQTSEALEQNADIDEESKPDYFAVISSITLFFFVLFIFAIFETIATPLCMHMFAWKKAEATLYVGIMLGGAGVVSIFVFAVIKLLSKRFNERYLLLGGFIMCFLGFVVYLPWGHQYPAIQYAEIDIPETNINSTWNDLNHDLPHLRQYRDITKENSSTEQSFRQSMMSDAENKLQHKNNLTSLDNAALLKQTDSSNKTFLYMYKQINKTEFRTNNSSEDSRTKVRQESNIKGRNSNHEPEMESYVDILAQGIPFQPSNFSSNSSKEAVGCPYYYKWCFYTPAILLWQFLLGTFFVAVGYPTCNVMSYTIFSKILGPKPQGIWMGWLTAAGSLARCLGPVFVSQVYDAYGPRVTMITLLCIIFLTIIGLLVSFKRLVPFKSTNRSLIVESK
ncbi:Major facilitator superfamily domain-containing protein 8 [Mactra antiquata]